MGLEEREDSRVSLSEWWYDRLCRRAGKHMAYWPTPACCLCLDGPGARNGFTFLIGHILNGCRYLYNILAFCFPALKAENTYNLAL